MQNFFRTILMMYVTLAPTVIAGVINSVFCKLPVMKSLSRPLDGGRCLRDGKRIFGDNKTWKGIAGYFILNVLFSVIWGLICSAGSMESLNYFYLGHENTIPLNILIGFLLGAGYSLFELPNSFIKRRLDITPGKTINGPARVFFIFLDQADSVFGCALVIWIFYDLGILLYLGFVLVGALTHILINMLLYFLKLRKNMF